MKFLSNYMEELVISCQKAGSDCDFNKEHIYWWFQPDFFKCFTFDIMKGKHMDEATSQGKLNLAGFKVGVTWKNPIVEVQSL